MNTDQNLIETDLIIDAAANMHLKETAIWGKFLSIMGIIYSVLIVLGAMFAGSTISKFSAYSGSNGTVAAWSIAFIYVIIAAVLFFMSLFLYRFSKKTQLALQTNDTETLTMAFKNLKVYFRFAGIITVVGLIFTVLGIIGIILVAAFRG